MRDLEIRGAGNILGAEQHGHMLAIGFNLYAKLLRRAVGDLRGELSPERPETSIDIRVDAYIPNSYVSDNDMKIDIYKRIRDADSTEAVDGLRSELSDRFGKMPGEVEALLEVQALRVVSEGAGVRRVSLAGGEVEAEFATGHEPKPSTVRAALDASVAELTFNATSGLVLRFAAPHDRREALRLSRKVLKHFVSSGNL
jgi:transcription-repair coupling factor (superfamily II helicase)